MHIAVDLEAHDPYELLKELNSKQMESIHVYGDVYVGILPITLATLINNRVRGRSLSL